jgi:hypothetical protein
MTALAAFEASDDPEDFELGGHSYALARMPL